MKKKTAGILAAAAVVAAIAGITSMVSGGKKAPEDAALENIVWEQSKVDGGLLAEMESVDEETLIPVEVQLYDIDHSRIDGTAMEIRRDPERPREEKIPSRQEVSRRLHSEYVERFIREKVDPERTILYRWEYLTRVALAATKSEIRGYTMLPEVEALCLHTEEENLIPMPATP